MPRPTLGDDLREILKVIAVIVIFLLLLAGGMKGYQYLTGPEPHLHVQEKDGKIVPYNPSKHGK